MNSASRRQFIVGAAASASALLLRADSFCQPQPANSVGCNATFLKIPRPDLAAQPNTSFHFHEPQLIKRPLWSDLKRHPKRAAQYAKDIKRAYDEMTRRSTRDPADTMGLAFQVAWHNQFCANAADVHSNWKFLPWHRGFIYFHEKLLRKILGKSRDDFRLAVWDWDNLAEIPSPYRQWGGAASPLKPGVQRCHSTLDHVVNDCALRAWLTSRDFYEFVGRSPKDPTAIGPEANSGPHSFVHKYVGGFLGPTNTAAADPVFYAHHANIDRLWCYWWNHYRGQPGFDCDRNWLCESLLFNDPDDGLVSIKVRDLLDESRLGYSYELPDKTLCFPFRVVLGTVGALGVVIYAKDAWVDLMSVVLEATHDPLRAWETALVQWVTFMELMEHRGQNASFPLAFVVPADRLRPTDGYYLLAVCPPCETGPTNRRVIGSFAVFASSHGKPAGSFANAVCLSGPDLVYVISTAVSKGGIGLVYGPPTADGCDIVADGARPLDVSSVEIRYPATPQDYRKLLGM